MNTIEKNKRYEITIDDLGNSGEGIGRIDGFAVFVAGGLPKERLDILIVKVNKTYAFGKIMEILEASPERVLPICPVAKFCGGCQLQHLSYNAQVDYKAKKVRDALERIGSVKDVVIEEVISMEEPLHYRNKAQFPIGMSKEGLQIGFFAKRSHRIVDTDICYLQHEINVQIIEILRTFLEEFRISIYNEETHKGLVRHIITRVSHNTKEIMVCLVLNGNAIGKSEILVERLRKIPDMASIVLNENRPKTNVILGEKTKTLWGKDTISDTIDGTVFEISPQSFYQVNPVQMERLYQKALAFADVKETDVVADLYCGIGTISLTFAKKVKHVYGVEIVDEAIADAKNNAKNNGIDNVSFYAGAVEDVFPKLCKEEAVVPEVVVLDPPRKGCERAVLDCILSVSPKTVVYVSCDPATMARDVKVLTEGGYVVEKVSVVDQFCFTTHVETVVRLVR
ncbi:MAG: 23S rRNA (uracil(1939)-C(5))-methyltransferase RlmD [Bacillota bacterium]